MAPDPFTGRSEHSLDAKNRLTIPARFREGLGSQVTLTIDPAGCLSVLRRDAFATFVDALLATIPPLSKDYDVIQRYYLHSSENVDIDSAGRVAIASHLVKHAGLEKDVLVAGTGNRLELWEPGAWRTANDQYSVDIDAIRARHAG